MVEPDVPRTISGDAVRLGQVVGNLVNNALKFTEAGFVKLTVSKGPAGSRLIDLTVEDTGIGIPADKLSTIFEVFTQADQTTTRKFGGTGLGLAICRRIVTAMGGEIEVSSVVGVGSKFRVRIPTGDDEQPSVARARHQVVGAICLYRRRSVGRRPFPHCRIISAPSVIRLNAPSSPMPASDYGSAAMVVRGRRPR